MSEPLALQVQLEGAPPFTLDCPPRREIAPRAWLLGVVAVQLTVVNNEVSAQFRIHRTGQSEPKLIALADNVRVHVGLVKSAVPTTTPILDRSTAPARSLSVFLDGHFVRQSSLAEAAVTSNPPPRAFGHVFCRWLASGEDEAGFDLTDFVSQPRGQKFERTVLEPLKEGQIVTYWWKR